MMRTHPVLCSPVVRATGPARPAAVLAAVYLLVLAVGLAAAQQPMAGDTPMNDLVQRETIEWSNIWWSHANDDSLPRVLLIGDSISVGYSPLVTELLKAKVNVDRFGTSRSINDPALIEETRFILAQYRYVAIHFNNGLHGGHLPDDVYAAALADYVKLLRDLGQGAKLVWGSSTPVTVPNHPDTVAEDRNARVVSRNQQALAVMQAAGIPVDDLYGAVFGRPELKSADGVHLNGDGYQVLGKGVAEALLPLLP